VERAGGLIHVCYEVDEIEEQLTLLRSRGRMIIRRPKPAIAFDGRMIAWVFTAQKAPGLQKDKQQLT
jgi:methylmalonyl-CoA/ethylmalonyl-CoA epimerase